MKKATIRKLNIIFVVLFCLFPSLAKADIYSGVKNYCYDELSILDENTKENIRKTNLELESKIGCQIVVATMENPDGREGMEYGSEIFNKLRIGNKEKDNGVLILFLENKTTGQKEISIIPGYGLEGALNDAKVGRIIDNFMLDSFKKGEYSKGLNEGFNAIVGEVVKEYGIEIDGDYEKYQNKLEDSNGFSIVDLMIILLVFIIFSNLISRLKHRPYSNYSRGGRYRGNPYWTSGNFGNYNDDDDFWSGWSSGGGFTGGGGSTGGGGASRKF